MEDSFGRGRDASYPAPPAQSPACGTTAPGSCLGSDVLAPGGACRTPSGTCDRGDPALCPVPGMLRRSRGAPLVPRLPRYSGAVRLPAPVPHGRTPWVHRAGLAFSRQVSCRASRVPSPGFLCMPEVADPARAAHPSPSRGVQCGLPRVRSASAPRTGRLRGAILCRHLPLSTLRQRRYRRLRMTRGQCGWLDLHGQGLTPYTTVPACPGAYPNAGHQARREAGARHERTMEAVACTPWFGWGWLLSCDVPPWCHRPPVLPAHAAPLPVPT